MNRERYKGDTQAKRWLATLLLMPLSQLAASPPTESVLSVRDAEQLLGILRQHGLRLDDLDTAALTPSGLLHAVQSETSSRPTATPLRESALRQRRMNRALTDPTGGQPTSVTEWRSHWFTNATERVTLAAPASVPRASQPVADIVAPSVPGLPGSPAPAPPSGGDGLFTIQLKPPPGFEAIEYPYEMEVAVWWRGRHVIQTRIEVMPTVFRFLVPDEVFDSLGQTVSDQSAIRERLAEPLAINAEKLCLGFNDLPDCGSLSTDLIDAILDLDGNRVDLFVGDRLVNDDLPAFLPAPPSSRKALLRHHTIASLSDSADDELYAAAGLLYSYGPGHIGADVDYRSETDRARLYDFNMTHYLPDYQLVAGGFAHRPGGSSADLRMLGVTVFHSKATRLNRSQVYGTPIDVSLERPATVQLVIDDRLFAGQYLEAGVHRLNTSALPFGSNEVEVRIRDASGEERVKTVRFNKFSALPDPGSVEASLTLGTPVDLNASQSLPASSGEAMFSTLLAVRAGENNKLAAGITQLDARSYWHAQMLHLNDWGHYQLAATADDAGNRGLGAEIVWRRRRLGFSLTAEHTDNTRDDEPTPTQQRLIADTVDRASLGSQLAVGDYRMGLRGDIEETPGEEREYGGSAFVERRWFSGGGIRTSAELRYQHVAGADSVLFGVRVTERNGRRSRSAAATALVDENRDVALGGEVAAGWTSPSSSAVQISASTFARVNDDAASLGAQSTLTAKPLSADAAAIVSDTDGQRRHDAYVSVGGTAAAGTDSLTPSGDRHAVAGVLIRLDGDASETQDRPPRVFDVFVNNSRRAEAVSGQSTFLTLEPFRSYSVHLAPRGNGFVRSASNEVHEFTLYPGTVHEITLDTAGRFVLVAKIVNAKGERIALARTSNLDEVAITDENGVLQAEVTVGGEVDLLLGDDEACRVEVPDNAGEDFLIVDAPLICL